MTNVVEELRQRAVQHVMGVGTMRKNWPQRRKKIRDIIGGRPDGRTVLSLGDRLSDIFRLKGTDGRGQGSLSAAGITWECLVCWYCNLCLVGSRAVVVKTKKDTVPKPMLKAVSVNMENVQANSEADLMAITFPNRPEYREQTQAGSLMMRLSELADEHFGEYGLGIIQCKTNWNDSVQVPMLWDMIYRIGGYKRINLHDISENINIHVGSDGYSIHDIGSFWYAFATVPTNDHKGYRPNSIAVLRAKGLSGGNYWGHGTKSGVAMSLKEIIGKKFGTAFDGPITDTMTEHLKHINSRYGYFKL